MQGADYSRESLTAPRFSKTALVKLDALALGTDVGSLRRTLHTRAEHYFPDDPDRSALEASTL
jgi:hypothetical protein